MEKIIWSEKYCKELQVAMCSTSHMQDDYCDRILTQHDFISGDDNIELEGISDDLPSTVPVVQFILMDQSPAVRTARINQG